MSKWIKPKLHYNIINFIIVWCIFWQSFFGYFFLFDNFDYLYNELLKLSLSNLAISINIEFLEDIVDILFGRLFNIKGISQSDQELTQLMLLNIAWVVSIEGTKGVLEFLPGNTHTLLKTHLFIIIIIILGLELVF